MSATRLIVLGTVRAFGRTHGYQVGTELHSWGAHEWANVKWGSIYHALKQLTKQGLLRSFEVDTGPSGQPRTEYEITETGEEEFFRLLRAAVTDPGPHNEQRATGVVFLPALPRTEAVALLEERIGLLEETLRGLEPYHTPAEGSVELRGEVQELPSIVGELFGMWAHVAMSEIAWTRGLIERLKAGMHTMAGEDDRAWGAPGAAGTPPGG